ncbi:MAG: class I SAM-dependent methyltransferase [Candidatus Roizmanbacteria bacterium]|nr:class I SAM-dependent methyltransferase [Candidatus Roizmanbacteria bacterium]
MKTVPKKITKEFYDKSSYFSDFSPLFLNRKTRFQTYRIQKVLEIYTPKKTDRVLDLGCGWGTFSFMLAPSCKEVIGLDYSKKSIELCNRQLKNNKKKYRNVRFVCRDAKDTGLKQNSLNVIISADLVEHVYPDDFEKIIKECKRLLVKGGKLVIWTPSRSHFIEMLKNNNILIEKDVSHVDYKSMDRIIEMLQKYKFSIEKSYYAESHLPFINGIERLFLPYIPLFRRRIAVLAQRN